MEPISIVKNENVHTIEDVLVAIDRVNKSHMLPKNKEYRLLSTDSNMVTLMKDGKPSMDISFEMIIGISNNLEDVDIRV